MQNWRWTTDGTEQSVGKWSQEDDESGFCVGLTASRLDATGKDSNSAEELERWEARRGRREGRR
jgi:hypothetical protein